MLCYMTETLIIHEAFQFRLYPTEEQASKLRQTLGSKRFVYNHFLERRQKVYAETGKGKLEVGGTGTAKNFDALLTKHNEKYDFQLKKTASGVGPSDHTSFYEKGVPVYFFFTGLHGDYHEVTDEPQYIAYDNYARLTRYLHDLVLACEESFHELEALP